MSIEVNWTDQQKINEFSNLNFKRTALEDELFQLQNQKELLQDASAELELADDTDTVPFQLGNSFVILNCNKALHQIEQSCQSVNDRIESVSSLLATTELKMSELKSVLYAKFGKTINLEHE